MTCRRETDDVDVDAPLLSLATGVDEACSQLLAKALVPAGFGTLLNFAVDKTSMN